MLNYVKGKTSLAPIALFAYKRVSHLSQVIDSLLSNQLACNSDLYIFSDCAKNADDAQAVADVRSFIRSIDGFRSVNIVEREFNYGLANSIISGVTELLLKDEKIIVLEDDLVCSKYFLDYMNEALTLYQNDERVISITGYIPRFKISLPDTFFLRGTDCWGWGTWRRGWPYFQEDGRELLAELKANKLTELFDMNGAYKNTKMLENQILGLNDSWAIRWHASGFLANKLSLFPGKSLIRNIGNDGSGTHGANTNGGDVELSDYKIKVSLIDVAQSQLAFDTFYSYYKNIKPHLFSRMIRRLFNRINR